MLIFAHSGIALGIAVLLNDAITKSCSSAIKGNKLGKHHQHPVEAPPTQDYSSAIKPFSFTYLVTRLDLDTRTAFVEPSTANYYTQSKELTDLHSIYKRV